MNIKYTESEKQNFIEEYLSGRTVNSILSENNIPKSTFYRWVKKYNKERLTNKKYYDVSAPASQIKIHDMTFTLSSVKPTRSGYTFLGWSTSSTASNPSYYPGGNYILNSPVIFYAVWQNNTQATTYTVSYDANGGYGAPASQTKTNGVPLTLSTVTPTWGEYTFLGWSEGDTETYPTYYPGGSYTNNVSTILYAVWQYNNVPNTYTISYNANGGYGAPASQTKTHGVTLTLSTAVPWRSGYTFLGWGTSSTSSYPSYYPGGSYTANTSAIATVCIISNRICILIIIKVYFYLTVVAITDIVA